MSKIVHQSPGPQPLVTAHSIVAEAFAVGPNATAITNQRGVKPTEVVDAFLKLQNAVASLGLTERERIVIEKDLSKLADAVKVTPPDAAASSSHLKAVVAKLEMTGVVASKIAAIAEPVRQIAEAAKLPLSLLGF